MKTIGKLIKAVGNFFVKWKKLFLSILACSGAVLAIIGIDNLRRKVIGDKFELHKSIRGDFKNSSDENSDLVSKNDTSPDGTNENTISGTNSKNMSEGFSDIILTDSENIGKGSLALINSKYAPESFYTGLCSIEPDEEKYILNNPQTLISENVLPHLKDMINDYNAATEKNNIVIYNTTEECGELYSQSYPENVSGYSFDIAVNSSYGEIIEYDGLDTEGWISLNCHNYGFITRFPENKEDITGNEYSPYHFRYVGIPHAMIMNENNMCLEEYTEYLKEYSFENPLVYTVDNTEYFIYYSKATIPSTTLYVPENSEYEISGNNYDGYIVSYFSGVPSVTETVEQN